MRLGLNIGYSGARIELPLDLIQEADRLGYHAVWTAEAYGSDCISPLAWVGALTKNIKLGSGIIADASAQPGHDRHDGDHARPALGRALSARTGLVRPAGGRRLARAPIRQPLGKTREYVSIVRRILAREAPLRHAGAHYRIPYDGEDATGLGKPLKSIVHGRRDMPIYLAAIGPLNVALAAEIADGWLPFFFRPRITRRDIKRRSTRVSPGRPQQEPVGFRYRALRHRHYRRRAGDGLQPDQTGPGRFTSAAWAPRARTSITTWLAALVMKPRRTRYKTITCRAVEAKRSWPCPDDLVDAVSLVGSKARIPRSFAALARLPAHKLEHCRLLARYNTIHGRGTALVGAAKLRH